MRKNILIIILVLLFLGMAAGLGIAIGTIDTSKEFEQNYAPYIGENGNWWIGEEDTECPATGIPGQTPTIEISADGYWVINGTQTTYKAQGEAVIPTIGEDGYWYVGTEKLGLAIAKNIEFNVSETHIQWRYVGDTEWKDLVELETLKGADGQDGTNGTDGKDGVDGEDGEDGKDGIDGADGLNGIGLNYKAENGWFYVKYENENEYTPIWNFKYNAATPEECAEVAVKLALEELADLSEGLSLEQVDKVIADAVIAVTARDTSSVDSIHKLNTLVASINEELAATKIKVNEILSNIYEVFYFFSAAPGVSPEVQKVVAGEVLELLVPNGTQLINGQVKWYSYELNKTTGKYQLVEITDGYVMPQRDLYLYANYDGQLKPFVSFELDGNVYLQLEYTYFADVTTDELNAAINQIDFTVDALRGYEFAGWYFDEACLLPIEDFTILADTTVYAKLQPKPFNVTFDLNYGTSNEQLTQVVLFKDYITPITATRLGYKLAGWYYNGVQFDFANTTMPAEDITLTAKWEAIDVVKEVANKANEVIADVLNLTDVTDSPVYVTVLNDTFVNPENEDLQLVDYVMINVDLNKLADIRSLSIDKSFFTKQNILDIVRSVASYILGNNAIVNDLTVGTDVVFADEQFKTSVINDLANNVINSVLDDLVNEVNPKLLVTVDDVLCEREVEVEVVILGSAEKVAKLREKAKDLAKRFEVVNNGNLDITFDVPSSVIQILEGVVADKFAGVTLYQGINNLTIEDAIRLVLSKAESLVGDKTGADEKLCELLVRYECEINRILHSDRYDLRINGTQVLVDGATFAPASSSYEDVCDALIAVINPALLSMTFEEFDRDLDRTYTVIIDATVTLPNTDKVDQTVISQQVILNLVTKANKYQIKLDANGGEFTTGGDYLVIYEITGTELPTNLVKPLHTFVCWVDENGKEYTAIGAEYANLTAKWQAKEFTIEYDVNGVEANLTYGTTTELVTDVTYVDNCTVNELGVVDLAAAVATNGTSVFVGWELNGVVLTEANMVEVITAALGTGSEITLVARWA